MPRSRFLDCMLDIFLILRESLVFHSGCTILYAHQPCANVQVSLHPHQHLLFLLWIIAILMSVVSHFVLSLISLMIIDGEHLFLCLLVIWIYTFLRRNAYSSSLSLKKKCVVCFCCWVTEVLYILWIQSLFLFFPFFSPSGP